MNQKLFFKELKFFLKNQKFFFKKLKVFFEKPKVFSKGAENLNYRLLKGQSVRFQYRVVITSGIPVPATGKVPGWVKDFEKNNPS